MKTKQIDISVLHELLVYNPDTGEFTNKTTRRGNAKAGSATGRLNKTGYVYIGIKGTLFRAHRLAWVMVHGYWPPDEIDHINGNKSQNNIASLRLATRSENCQNTKPLKNNTSGIRGVSKYRNKWQAEIRKNNKHFYLGRFTTPEEAHAVYIKAAAKLHGEFQASINFQLQQGELVPCHHLQLETPDE